MSWEIIERRINATLWQSKDAEGRRIYTATRDRDGIASEPSGGAHRSKRSAWQDWRDRSSAGAAMGRAKSEAKTDAARRNAKKGGWALGVDRRSHVPAVGRASGLSGPALCGRWTTYGTGDHALIRNQALAGGDHWCKRCLKRL